MLLGWESLTTGREDENVVKTEKQINLVYLLPPVTDGLRLPWPKVVEMRNFEPRWEFFVAAVMHLLGHWRRTE